MSNNIIRGYVIQITNNTPDMAEIRDLKVESGGWWQPRLPMLLSGQGGAAYGEAYRSESVSGSFTILLPTVKFLCDFSYNLDSGATFNYTPEGSNEKHYAFDPPPYPTSHGTTATVGINIVDPQTK